MFSTSAWSEPVFTLVNSNIALEPGASGGTAALVLQAQGIEGSDKIVDVVDNKVPEPPAITVDFETKELDRGGKTGSWLLTAVITGVPRGTPQQTRYLTVKFGKSSYTLSYTLTNAYNQSFAWTVKGPPGELSLRPGQSIEIGIAVEGVPATKVALLQASFIENHTKTTAKDGWDLCAKPDDACDTEYSIPANSVKRLWLRPKAAVVGKYTGTVIIFSAEKPTGVTLSPLTVYGTTSRLQWLGVLVILIAVVLSWLVFRLIQQRINRTRMLLPIARLQVQVRSLQARLDKTLEETRTDSPLTQNALKKLSDRLKVTDLDSRNLLPPRIPLPTQNPFDSASYEQFIKTTGDWITFIGDVIIGSGFEQLTRLASGQWQDAVNTAAKELDKLVPDTNKIPDSPPPDRAASLAAIDTALDRLRVKFLNYTGGEEVPVEPKPTILSPEGLSVDINVLSLAVWAAFALVTTALGVYVLIYNNPGFGTLGDFLVCAFWGFGLPIGAQQLTQLSVANVSQSLGISIPQVT
jgi:hypothetical protein